MIHPDTRISYVDKTTGRFQESFIEVILRTYATMENKLSNGDTIIRFRDHHIMVKDAYGWTELVEIIKHQSQDPMEFIEICNSNGIGAIVTTDELVPCYYPNITKEGFHGRTLYAYHLRKATDLYDGMHVRHVASYDPQDQFKSVYTRPYKGDNKYTAYTIHTIADVYAANYIMLWGGIISGKDNIQKLTEYGWN